jgi:hypothetical protein
MPIVAKLDELGKPAWIALMILGFMVWWPVGLATLAFIIGSGRMSWKAGSVTRWHEATGQMRSAGTWWQPSRSSGNRAFDDYREETLRRLEEEQREFQGLSRSLAGGEGQSRVSISSWRSGARVPSRFQGGPGFRRYSRGRLLGLPRFAIRPFRSSQSSQPSNRLLNGQRPSPTSAG